MATVNPLLQQIDAIAKEKGVEPEIIISAVQDAIEAAARKRYKNESAARALQSRKRGQLELYAVKQIVEDVTDPPTQISLDEAQQLYGDEAEVDMEIEFPRPTEDLGRIAAQTAKQVIFQKVREAERENVYAEYSQRVGEVVNGMVKRFENGDIIVELGRVEAQLPRKEQSRAENYTVSDRVRAVIRGVNRSAKGPQIVLSRTDPALLDQAVRAGSAGDLRRHRDDPRRRPRGRRSRQGGGLLARARRRSGRRLRRHEGHARPVDHPRAARREDRHRRVVRRSDRCSSPTRISPAKVQRVSIVDDGERVMEVVVEDKQLSLAIGKKGQNVRLAAKLTGWKIDIKSEEEKRREVEAQFGALEIGEPAARGEAEGGRAAAEDAAEAPRTLRQRTPARRTAADDEARRPPAVTDAAADSDRTAGEPAADRREDRGAATSCRAATGES